MLSKLDRPPPYRAGTNRDVYVSDNTCVSIHAGPFSFWGVSFPRQKQLLIRFFLYFCAIVKSAGDSLG